MNKLSTLRIIVVLTGCILLFEVAMLIVMVKPDTFYLKATIAVIGLLCLYLLRLSWSLIKELQNKEKP